MTQIKHTPGPWIVGDFGRIEQLESGALIATLGPAYGTFKFERLNANARLIAAAPELLAALDLIAGQSYNAGVYGENEANARLREVYLMARAAIAKTTGEN